MPGCEIQIPQNSNPTYIYMYVHNLQILPFTGYRNETISPLSCHLTKINDKRDQNPRAITATPLQKDRYVIGMRHYKVIKRSNSVLVDSI